MKDIQWLRVLIFMAILAIVSAVWYQVFSPVRGNQLIQGTVTTPGISRAQCPNHSDGLSTVELAAAISKHGGESHRIDMGSVIDLAKGEAHLSPSDIQTLLTFISAPKPGNLTDGEWEERVNGILNLLRRQTQDFKTPGVAQRAMPGKQDAREDGAGSLASSLADDGHRPPLQAESAVPGLTEVLLEMAEMNGSKVLRLYAMQHLSLWFGKERDPGKRRAMVDLLEKLATTPGGETAGCAVLMLADMRRQTQDGKTPGVAQRAMPGKQDAREEGAGSLAGSLSGAGHGVTAAATENLSAKTSAASASLRFFSADDGIDWGRVDQVLETASRRLVGDAGAGVDVRISAIHACVDRRDAGALPYLRKVAADPSLVSTLRKAAIHGIGQLGTVDDLALLDSLPPEDGNLLQAVMPARQALRQRK